MMKTPPMRALLNVNFLIAIIDTLHIGHEPAHTWLGENDGGGWASCPLTQAGTVRLLSSPSYSRPMPIARALAAVQRLCAMPNHAFWPDTLTFPDAPRFNPDAMLGPQQITDTYLLALAVQNGGRLVTFDRRVATAAVNGFRPEHCVVVR